MQILNIVFILLISITASTASIKRPAKVLTLPELITQAAKKHKVERPHLSCILKIESEYRLNVISRTRDHGIGQINERTAIGFKMDLDRLTTDLSYSIDRSAHMLAYYQWLKRKDEPTKWVCRYNVGPAPLTKAFRGAKCVEYLDRFYSCVHKGDYL